MKDWAHLSLPPVPADRSRLIFRKANWLTKKARIIMVIIIEIRNKLQGRIRPVGLGFYCRIRDWPHIARDLRMGAEELMANCLIGENVYIVRQVRWLDVYLLFALLVF